jgi:hypothetical protein
MNKNKKLYGIGGWLLWFIIVLVGISPLFSIVNTANFINTSEYNNRFLTTNSTWNDYVFFTYIFLFWSTIWQWYVGHHLLTNFESSSVAKVRTLLLVEPIFFFLKDCYFLSQLGADRLLLSIFFHTFIPCIIWLLYFSYSKRVRITYLDEQVVENDKYDETYKKTNNKIKTRSPEEYIEDNFDEIKKSIKNKVSLKEIYDNLFNEVEQELFSFNEFKSICKKLYYGK